MNIIWLLLQSSWISVSLAVAAGLISRASSASLIALINTAIEQGTPRSLILPFAGLALLPWSLAQCLSSCS